MSEGRFKTDGEENNLDERTVFSGKSGDCVTFGTQNLLNDTASSEIKGFHVKQHASH
jgi:hypothetical protein